MDEMYTKINTDANTAFGFWNHVEFYSVADVSEDLTAAIITDDVWSSETSATQPSSTRCQHPKTGSTSIMNHLEHLKSVITHLLEEIPEK
jgi:hypothetical protein